MTGKKSVILFIVVVVVLLGLAIPLQYLVRREVVAGLPPGDAHAHAHGEEEHKHEHEHEHPEEEGHLGAEVPLGVNLISNYGFEVGTREQIWGWAKLGKGQGAVIYRDDNISHSGLASAAVNANNASVIDAGWIKRLDELPRAHDVIFEGYIKTEELQGEAYLRVWAEAGSEGDEGPHMLVQSSTDDVSGNSDWTLSRLQVYIPPEATEVWLDFGVYGRGRAWFDDLSLVVEEREDVLVSQENLLKNPSFEGGIRYWHILSETEEPVLDYGILPVGPDGGEALFLRDDTPGAPEKKYSCFYQTICGLYGHKGTFILSGWLRAENISGNGFMRVVVYKPDEDIHYVSSTQVSGVTPWREFGMYIPVDGDIASVRVMISLEGSGTLYVDDLEAVFHPE